MRRAEPSKQFSLRSSVRIKDVAGSVGLVRHCVRRDAGCGNGLVLFWVKNADGPVTVMRK